MARDSNSEEDLTSKYARLKRLTEEHPFSGELWLEYAIFLHTEFHSAKEAVVALRKAQPFFPEKDLRLRLGDALSQTGEHSQGLYLMYQFLQSHPTAFAYGVIAHHLLAREDFEKPVSLRGGHTCLTRTTRSRTPCLAELQRKGRRRRRLIITAKQLS